MPLAPPLAALGGPRPERRTASAAAGPLRLWLEEERFEPFYAETAPRLRAYLRRIAGSPAVADDLLQESFLRFLTRPLREGSAAQWRSYLFQIATNLARDRWRWERRESGFLERLFAPPPPAASPERRLTAKADLAAAFSRLSSRDRALLWLAYVEGCEHTEIATILGLRPASVRVLLFRLRRKVASLLPDSPTGTGGEP